MDVLELSEDHEGGGSDELTGQRKSRLKSIKSRLFGKIKRKDDYGDGGMKQSQSESDITFDVEDSEQEHCSQGILGSRALSHDSIFLAEDSHLDPEPSSVLSHENIHGKIQALQMKLQLQKMHLGPPPRLLPIKHHVNIGGSQEDDGFPRLSKSISNKPLFPHPIRPASAPISQFVPNSGVDFSTPPQLNSLLDNSAARHRMSIKPKKQRASAKNKRTVTLAESRPRSESLNNMEHSLTEKEEGPFARETPRPRSYSSKMLRTGEKQAASQIKGTSSVSPLMYLQDAEESRQVLAKTDLERKLLSTSPQSHGKIELTPAETTVSTTRQEATKETKCLPRSEAQAAKLPSPLVSVDRKGKGEVNSSQLFRNNQSNFASTLETRVDTIQEPSISQDGKTSSDVAIQNKINTSSKCGVQNVLNVENCHSSSNAPVSVISAVKFRLSSLRRNAPSTEEKYESKTLQPVMTGSTGGQEGHSQTDSTKQHRPVSGSFHFTVSSDKIQERPRTSSFTGVVGQAGLKKESPSKPSPVFKIQGQLSAHFEKTKDPNFRIPPESQKEDRAPSHPVIPTKFTDLATNHSQTQNVKEIQDNEMQELGVEATEEEVQEGVEEAEEAGEDVGGVGEGKDATKAFGVKLRSTSLSLKFRLDKAQSEIKVKPHSSEASPPFTPLGSRSDSTSCVEPEVYHTIMGSKPKDPPLRTNESSISSCTLMSVLKDKETTSFLRHSEPPQPLSLPSKATNIVPSPPKEGADLPAKEPTAVSSQENASTSTTSEFSWMEMAREKTRSLQQLFTSRLPEFPGLQTTTRPTTFNTQQPQMQTSTLQANARTTQNITSQQTATQLPLRPTEVTARQLPTAQASGRSMQPMQTHTRTSQPSATQTCTIQATTSQSQDDSSREVLFQSKPQICSSTTKTAQSSVTCTPNIQSITHTLHTAKQLPSQPQTPKMQPIQQLSPLRAGPLQASQTSTKSMSHPAYPYISSSPKVTPNLLPQQSVNTVSMDPPQNEASEPSIAAGKADRVGPQGKGPGLEDGRPLWAAGLGNKAPLLQRWESQSITVTKAGEQKDTQEAHTVLQSSAPIRSTSKVLGTDTDIDPMRTEDREDKCQKKSVPPSSSPSSSPSSPLQSICDSGQPSWMELAKRKSLAWSDKPMDYTQSKGKFKARNIMS